MKKKGRSKTFLYIALVIVIIIFLVGGYFLYSFLVEQNNNLGTGSSSSGSGSYVPPTRFVYEEATEEDFTNFEKIISKNEMIQDLPTDGTLILSFYKFVAGVRMWEKEYILTKGNVVEGKLSDYDIRLIMHSKYLTVLDENNFCTVVQTAQKNGDFASETDMSTFSLAWKYKGMMDYKDCLGL